MSTESNMLSGKIEATPEALLTPSRGLTLTNRHYRSEGSMEPILSQATVTTGGDR